MKHDIFLCKRELEILAHSPRCSQCGHSDAFHTDISCNIENCKCGYVSHKRESPVAYYQIESNCPAFSMEVRNK